MAFLVNSFCSANEIIFNDLGAIEGFCTRPELTPPRVVGGLLQFTSLTDAVRGAELDAARLVADDVTGFIAADVTVLVTFVSSHVNASSEI